MKQIIVALMFIACLFAGACFGQSPYKVEGKIITSVATSTEKQKVADKNTGYTFQDKQNVAHEVFITKNGRCYYNKVSAKTGNTYKVYLDEETSRQIASAVGVEYKERAKKQKEQ